MFLMHRVELKGILDFLQQDQGASVPNAPCGVERREIIERFLKEKCS